MWVLLIAAAMAGDTRLILLGDAGEREIENAEAEVGCDKATESLRLRCTFRSMLLDLKRRVSDERPDAVIVLGDNFYGRGPGNPAPPCPPAHPSEKVVGRYLAQTKLFLDAKIPVYGVLGNHDVGHDFLWGRRCSTAAMEKAGWLPVGGIGAVALGDGVARLLDTTRIVGTTWRPRANAAALKPPAGRWTLWAGHHPWSLQAEKGRQPLVMRKRVERAGIMSDQDPPNIWVSGHAHHQEADVHEGVLAVTTGFGGEPRGLKAKKVDVPDEPLYLCSGPGYTTLDIHTEDGAGPTVTITAWGFGMTPEETGIEASATCAWSEEAWQCQSVRGARWASDCTSVD